MPHHEDSRAEVHRVVVGPLDNNVFVLRCKATGQAVLIDAADHPEQLLTMCRDLGVGLVLETHGHRDHIRAVPALRAAGYPVGIAAGDAPMLPGHDFAIEDGQVFEIGALEVRSMATPGHSPGSTSFLYEGDVPVLFAGDTLFPGGPGATRAPGSDFPTIIRSIEERLFTLDPETLVLPGHGADTTIGTERPHLGEWVARGW
jgi:glyoxylase-like metal-dependent hydrolase (beta-lactamase superfamily II)